MIRSMTAFARCEARDDWGHALFEIRSVNQRFLELSFRLPETFRHLEPKLRELAREKLARGKVEIQLRAELSSAQVPHVEINEGLAQALANAIERLKGLTGLSGAVDWTRFLQWPEMIEIASTDRDQLEAAVLSLFTQALAELVAAREREGAALVAHIEKRLAAIEEEIAKVRANIPEILNIQRERLIERFKNAQIELDETRLEQEMVIVAQRLDVDEEMDRLSTHVHEFRRVLQQGGTVGRRLDFLLQEMNREANTLGAKSINTVTTSAAVELKVLIEQIREQVQNIE